MLIGLSEFSGTLFTLEVALMLQMLGHSPPRPPENLPSMSAIGQPPAGRLYFIERAFIYHVTHTLNVQFSSFQYFQWCSHHPLFQIIPAPQYWALYVGVV